MALMPVEDALALVLGDAHPLAPQRLPLSECAGRVLAEPLRSLRTHPPADISAMDGYAVRAADVGATGVRLRVVGEAPAGRPCDRTVHAGEAIRIFTGGWMPEGADTVLIQENASVLGNGMIETVDTVDAGRHIRRAGLDFREGDMLLDAGRLMDPAALSLAAAANHAELHVVGRPLVAILATGDEIRPPGSTLQPGEIVSSNPYGIAALARDAGADVMDCGIVRDDRTAIRSAIERAAAAGAHVMVTSGGASVGDHDLVQAALRDAGASLDFWKIAMRPGKPLMAGRLGNMKVLGLPGNPVASLICSRLFLMPLLARLGGRSFRQDMRQAVLDAPLPENDQRQDYLRATARWRGEELFVRALPVQDSSMLRSLAEANVLIVRPRFAPGAEAGEMVDILVLREPEQATWQPL